MDNNTLSAFSLNDTLTLTINNLVGILANFLPRLLLAVAVLLIGILVAGWAKSLVKSVIRAIHLSRLVTNSPIERFFTQGNIAIKVDEILGEIGKLAVIYLFVIAAFSLVGLSGVATFLTDILQFIPRVLSALVIFILGVLGAGFVESMVKGAISSIDLATSRMMGKMASYMVVVFATLAAISELGLAQFFINALFIGFVAMLSVGLGLAFGLGTKDTVAQIVSRWYQREFPSHKSDKTA
jgi:hypothetical protein